MKNITCTVAGIFLSFSVLCGCTTHEKKEKPAIADCKNLSSDLNYIHESIKQNFSGYVHSVELRKSTDAVFNQELEAAPHCTSEVDYVRSIRKYLGAFKDPHVKANWFGISKYGQLVEVSSGKKIDPNQKSVSNFATGIYLVNYSNRFFVNGIDGDLLKESKVKIGDELLSCSGKTPTEILKNEILPFESVSAPEASFYRMTPNIFIRWDQARDTKISCDFLHGSTRYAQEFLWKEVPENYLETKFQKHPDKIYKIEKIPNGHWVKLRSFSGYDEIGIQQLKVFSEDAKKLLKDKIIVVDVRGNGGGNSTWGTSWIDNLFGYHEEPKDDRSWVLASPGNRGHFERLYEHLRKNNGVTISSEGHWKDLIKAVQTNSGKLVEVPNDQKQSEMKAQKRTGFSGKIYVLTDFMVFSSGETFVQELKMMPNTKQAGIATNASTYYSDIRFDVTPSGLVFNFPTMVEINSTSKRASGEALVPEIKLELTPEIEFKGRDSMREALSKKIERGVR